MSICLSLSIWVARGGAGLKAFSITDIGEKRSTNQDFVLCETDSIGNLPNLFIVADGMGGHNAGDYASRFCVDFITQHIRSSEQTSPILLIEEAIKDTNDKLYEKAMQQAEFEGMGTTLVIATICGNEMYVANIGDSRLYVVSKEIRQVTEDHSLVQAMVKTGELDQDEAKIHPNKNIITRALGSNKTAHADFFELELEEGDIVLLCSDGLTNMLEDETIERIVRENADDPKTATETLVKQANQNGGKDNITAIVVKV